MKKGSMVVVVACFAIGCAFWTRRAFSHEEVTTTVQFDREIVHILDNHCVMCHATNGPAFPLITYEQTYTVRRKMRMDALNRQMPPWAAVSGYGDFVNSNALTLREINFIVGWGEGWGPRNNGQVADAVAQPKVIEAHTDFDSWQMGKPDQILSLPVNTVAPHAADVVNRLVIDPNLKSDRWIRGLEYKPGDRRVVHAAVFTIQETGQWIGSWTPWYGFQSPPKGIAYRLPAGSHIVAEIRSYGVNDQVADRGTLGLYLTDQASSRPVSDLKLIAKPVDEGSPKRTATLKLTGDLTVLALKPEIGTGLQSVEVAARTPDGVTKVLLLAQDFPLAWPTSYIYKKPVPLSRGTEISVTEYYAQGSASEAPSPLVLSAYEGTPLPSTEPQGIETKEQEVPTQRYQLAGTVKSVNVEDGSLVVQHGAIPGFMGAMTMSYRAGKGEDLKKVLPGDQIQADVVVSGPEMHLENIKVTRSANTTHQ